MENKKKITPIVMVVMLTLALALTAAAFITTVSATTNGCPLETKYNGTLQGDIYYETSALKPNGFMQNPLTATFDNVPDKSKIKVARVYTGVWAGSPGKGGNYTIEVNGVMSPNYYCCDPCPQATGCDPWQGERCDALNATCNAPYNTPSGKIHHYVTGCNVNFISYDILNEIQAGTNTVIVTTEKNNNCPRGGWDGRVYMVALLVVYEDASKPQMTYWIDEGAPYMNSGSGCSGNADEIFNWFNGSVGSPQDMTYWTMGFPHVANCPTMTLNGNGIGQPDYLEEIAGYDMLQRWDNILTSYLNPDSNLFYYYEADAYYERIYSAVLKLPQEEITEPDLTVTNIAFPDIMRPDTYYTITATVENVGGAAASNFNVSLYANDVEKGTKPVPVLPAGNSIDVNFENVKLVTKGCYEFKVVADVYDQVVEACETNNETSAYYEVGYYIVVKSTSDFDALVTEGLARKEGDTYYIEDLEIANCGYGYSSGRGIWIENTTDQFVISNCTVQNCKEHGVYLENVTNGKISDSEVRDNSLKGIKLVKSSYVDITDNLVQGNSEYGIDLYPYEMPYADCEYVNITGNEIVENLYGIELIGFNCTVKDNLIRNSTDYGIYVYGNDSKVYNNTIKYCGDYGIKMDHNAFHPCNGNCVYGNTLIDNNLISGHISQGYDSGDNSWNSTVELCYFNDTSVCCTNYIGNNWSDYTSRYPGAVELDGLEIWDTPYDIDAGTEKDYSPLMEPWVNYDRVKCGDVNGDLNPIPTWSDGQAIILGNIATCRWAADVNCDLKTTWSDFQAIILGNIDCCAGCE